MAIESRRGCGYRKVGGLYLAGALTGTPCCLLPLPLTVCPCCGNGIKQGLGWQWINPKPHLAAKQCNLVISRCPMKRPDAFGDRVGLLWVGTQFYPSAQSFMKEAEAMGISKRIRAVPRGFEIGKSWVWLAHPKACVQTDIETVGQPSKHVPGVFYVWRPTALEKIVTETMAKDTAAMDALAKQGITPVVVPDNDKDHQGSVYDKPAEPGLFDGQ